VACGAGGVRCAVGGEMLRHGGGSGPRTLESGPWTMGVEEQNRKLQKFHSMEKVSRETLNVLY
jgi:hypothetical protein